jgi:uncharacterized membrane protein
VDHINQERYLAELDRLLGFMSSWDRQAALKKYRALFDACADEQALMDELGTPTKLAIELAASYVPTRPPSALAMALSQCPVALEDLLRDPGALAADLTTPAGANDLQPETWVFEQTEIAEMTETPEEEPEPETRIRLRRGVLAVYLIPAIVIGLPVTVALICLGLPFIGAGAAVIVTAALQTIRVVGQLRLVSDMLLTAGAALVAGAVGLTLCWLGLWISVELCWLWVGKALTGLGRRLCLREEAVG